MSARVTVQAECEPCGGTGLYKGMGECDDFAVVCHSCSGRGSRDLTYTPSGPRKHRADVRTVLEVNPGICVGHRDGHEFGGIGYEDWLAGKPFSRGTEDRMHTCPAWWFQSANYKLKPEWKECGDALGRSFSACKHYTTKEACWKRHDQEFKQ